MKKIITICIALVLVLSMAACTKKQESDVVKEEKQEIQQETTQQENSTKEDNQKTIANYAKLIGLSKDELINLMGEEPVVIDEGGLSFEKENIRVWCIGDGKTVSEVGIYSSDVDFDGVKIGQTIDDFKDVFGTPILEETQMGYSNFDYNGLVLNVSYDPSTKEIVAASLLKTWNNQ